LITVFKRRKKANLEKFISNFENVSNPVVPSNVKEIPVGSLWLDIPLYEKLFAFSATQNLTLPEAVLFIVKNFFGEAN
jgi:hypothetical protein